MTALGPRHGVDGGGRRCVLVVDHDASVRELATRSLGDCGHRVLAAADAAGALEALEEAPGSVDLLLVDLTLSGMGGQELARRARSAHPDLRVLYLSHYRGRAVREAGLEHPFLQKPLEPGELVRTVETLLPVTSSSRRRGAAPATQDPPARGRGSA